MGHWYKKSAAEADFMRKAGRRLRGVRMELKMTQKELSDAIECPPSLVNRFENHGHSLPTLKLARACLVMGCSVDAILFGDV